MGGKVALLWQPFEAVIIVGAAIGSFIIGNTASVVKATGSAINKSLKGSKYSKDNYVELISLLYQILKVAKTKGNLGLEKHIENPHDSALFQQFRSEEHTSELQSLMRISYAVFCLKKKKKKVHINIIRKAHL